MKNKIKSMKKFETIGLIGKAAYKSLLTKMVDMVEMDGDGAFELNLSHAQGNVVGCAEINYYQQDVDSSDGFGIKYYVGSFCYLYADCNEDINPHVMMDWLVNDTKFVYDATRVC